MISSYEIYICLIYIYIDIFTIYNHIYIYIHIISIDIGHISHSFYGSLRFFRLRRSNAPPSSWIALEMRSRRFEQISDRTMAGITGISPSGKLTFWVAYNDLTVLPHWKSWFVLGKSSPNGRKIQVSEIL